MAREATATARISKAELAEWRSKAEAAGVSLSALDAASDGADAHLDGGGAGHRAGALPRACPDRQQPQPNRTMGQPPQASGRGGPGPG